MLLYAVLRSSSVALHSFYALFFTIQSNHAGKRRREWISPLFPAIVNSERSQPGKPAECGVCGMELKRQNPDELLRALQKEEERARRGHLKIFFGFAAGVGKTYAMLQAAHAAKDRGVEVVVGYVEPHARPETAALLEGLECLPPKLMEQSGISVREFDLDAALERHPQLMLVDELAHTNAEHCRHAKRYQDIEELLKAGVDVYTTVNVQHIESLNDTVASITGVMVRQRIPDSVFDGAEQVELVDIEPEDLLKRLREGKVYREVQAERAVNNFFTLENLTALREIALRRCADRVNLLVENARLKTHANYHTDEHVLVCLSSAPSNAKIVRTGARMATAFRGNFTALFVETPAFAVMSPEDKNRLRANMRLAEQLGATIETVYGEDVPYQIAEFARLSGVSKIVIGRSSARTRRLFGKPSLTERLTVIAPNIDIHIIPDAVSNGFYREKKLRKQSPFSLQNTAKSFLILLAATLIGLLFSHLGFTEANIIMVYILGVLIISMVTSSRAYSLISSVVSVCVFSFFFTLPHFSLLAEDKSYFITFATMFIAAYLTGSLAVRLKGQAKQSAQSAFRTKVLFDTNQFLQKARDDDEILTITANQLMKLLDRDIVLYPVEENGLGTARFFSAGGGEVEELLTSNEKAVAAWVWKNNKHAGATTNTLESAKCLYLSIRINDTVYGVVGIRMGGVPLDSFENSVVLSILGECALALENSRNAREKAQAKLLAQNEQLRANLLRAISHDLRTPLTSISGNASNLISNGNALDSETKAQIYTDIYDDAMWLINLVENLLSVTRIEEGRMNLRMSTELMDEVVAEALKHINRKSAEHHITVKSCEDFLLAKMDARLIVQVLINLVDNAVKYTPVGSHIEIHTGRENGSVVVTVSDDGPGIPDEHKPYIFDMFYTGSNRAADSGRSIGLGLSLCKSIITAHGGEITVSDNHPHGTVFRFTLPAGEVTIHE